MVRGALGVLVLAELEAPPVISEKSIRLISSFESDFFSWIILGFTCLLGTPT